MQLLKTYTLPVNGLLIVKYITTLASPQGTHWTLSSYTHVKHLGSHSRVSTRLISLKQAAHLVPPIGKTIVTGSQIGRGRAILTHPLCMMQPIKEVIHTYAL